MKRLQLVLPEEVFDRLRRHAKATARTMTEIVRRGIERELERAPIEYVEEPTWKTYHLGEIKIPASEMREAANDRGL